MVGSSSSNSLLIAIGRLLFKMFLRVSSLSCSDHEDLDEATDEILSEDSDEVFDELTASTSWPVPTVS